MPRPKKKPKDSFKDALRAKQRLEDQARLERARRLAESEPEDSRLESTILQGEAAREALAKSEPEDSRLKSTTLRGNAAREALAEDIWEKRSKEFITVEEFKALPGEDRARIEGRGLAADGSRARRRDRSDRARMYDDALRRYLADYPNARNARAEDLADQLRAFSGTYFPIGLPSSSVSQHLSEVRLALRRVRPIHKERRLRRRS
jgi:hypothetical protein